MKRTIYILLLITMLLLAACQNSAELSNTGSGKIKIVASLFPQYDFARQIAKDRADVILLLPPGAESHTFDIKPKDMKSVYDADLFIYTGEYMEPWAGTVISGVTGDKPRVIDASEGVAMIPDDDGEHAFDPHIWLDSTIAMKMVESITDALCEIDADGADFYRKNRDEYNKKLEQLDDDFKTMIAASKRKTLVFGGRFAYIYFLKHYGLDYQTAYEGCSTESEPGAATIKGIIDYINDNKIPCIYYAELVDPKLARSIAEQTGISCELFSTAHNVTKDEFESGITFIDVMRSNFEVIKKGLN